MAYTKADVIWSGNCDIKSHFKDVNLVIHHFFKDHACNDLKFREMWLTESGKCVLVSKVPVEERNNNCIQVIC